jgi:hypothetical protein
MNRKPTKREIESLVRLATMMVVVAKGPPPDWNGVLTEEQKAAQSFAPDTLTAAGINW